MSATTAIAASSAATIAAAATSESSRAGHRRQTMSAVTQHRYGGVDVLNIEQIDRPSISANEVLVEVVAAGLDRGVVHLMTGMPYLIRIMGYGLRKPKNPVLGMDVSGRVVEVGSSVTRFEVGDEVMGIANGSFAEFAVADEAKLVRKPDGVSFAAAAASTISGITALQALTTRGNVAATDRVLVIGASGGVGTFAVQIAHSLGATVTGVASGEKLELVKSLGAADMIDYNTTDLGQLDREFDLIIDIGGRNSIRKLRSVLAPTGRLVIVGGEDGGKLAGGIGRQFRAALLSPFVKQRLGFFIGAETLGYIQSLADLLASGDVVPAVSGQVTLEHAPEGIRALAEGRVSGKIVVDIASSRDA